MATTIRELVASFGLKPDKKSIANAEKSIINFKNVAIAAVAAIGSSKLFKTFVEEVRAMGDNLDKTSQQIGMSTAALEEFRFAAGLSGVSANEMDMALGRLQKNAFDAATGSEMMAEDFARLGIQVKDSSGNLKSAETLVAEFADGIQNLDNDSEKVALSLNLMGRSGKKLLPMFANGSKGILDMRQEMKDLGGIMGKGLIDESVALTDNLLRFDMITKGIKNTIAKFLLPVFNKALEIFIQWWKINQDIVKGKITEYMEKLSSIGRKVRDVFLSVVDVAQWVATSFIDLYNNASPAIQNLIKGVMALVAVMMLPGAPILLMIGLIALLIQDFNTWRKGGESLFGDMVAGLNMVMNWMDKNVIAMRAIKAALGAVVIGFAAFKAGAIGAFIAAKVAAVQAGIAAAAAWVAATLPLILTIGLVGALAAALGFLVYDFIAWAKGGESFLKTLNDGISNLYEELGSFPAVIAEILDTAWNSWVKFFDDIFGLADGTIEKIKNPFKSLGKAISGFFGGGGSEVTANNMSSAVATPAASMQTIQNSARSSSNVAVTVNASPGMDENALANMVASRVKEVNDQQNRSVMDAFAIEGAS